MKVLMIGDVVAKPGRIAVLERIQDLREQHQIDLAIMNAENLAGGFSVTPSLCEQLFSTGIDVMTSGNHIFDKKEAIDYIRKQPRLLRPANYPPNTPGSGYWVGEVNGTHVAVINVMGRVFMPPSDDPFRVIDERAAVVAGGNYGSPLSTCMRKRRRKKSRWVGISMAAFQRLSALTLTCKLLTKEFCRVVLLI